MATVKTIEVILKDMESIAAPTSTPKLEGDIKAFEKMLADGMDTGDAVSQAINTGLDRSVYLPKLGELGEKQQNLLSGMTDVAIKMKAQTLNNIEQATYRNKILAQHLGVRMEEMKQINHMINLYKTEGHYEQELQAYWGHGGDSALNVLGAVKEMEQMEALATGLLKDMPSPTFSRRLGREKSVRRNIVKDLGKQAHSNKGTEAQKAAMKRYEREVGYTERSDFAKHHMPGGATTVHIGGKEGGTGQAARRSVGGYFAYTTSAHEGRYVRVDRANEIPMDATHVVRGFNADEVKHAVVTRPGYTDVNAILTQRREGRAHEDIRIGGQAFPTMGETVVGFGHLDQDQKIKHDGSQVIEFGPDMRPIQHHANVFASASGTRTHQLAVVPAASGAKEDIASAFDQHMEDTGFDLAAFLESKEGQVTANKAKEAKTLSRMRMNASDAAEVMVKSWTPIIDESLREGRREGLHEGIKMITNEVFGEGDKGGEVFFAEEFTMAVIPDIEMNLDNLAKKDVLVTTYGKEGAKYIERGLLAWAKDAKEKGYKINTTDGILFATPEYLQQTYKVQGGSGQVRDGFSNKALAVAVPGMSELGVDVISFGGTSKANMQGIQKAFEKGEMLTARLGDPKDWQVRDKSTGVVSMQAMENLGADRETMAKILSASGELLKKDDETLLAYFENLKAAFERLEVDQGWSEQEILQQMELSDFNAGDIDYAIKTLKAGRTFGDSKADKNVKNMLNKALEPFEKLSDLYLENVFTAKMAPDILGTMQTLLSLPDMKNAGLLDEKALAEGEILINSSTKAMEHINEALAVQGGKALGVDEIHFALRNTEGALEALQQQLQVERNPMVGVNHMRLLTGTTDDLRDSLTELGYFKNVGQMSNFDLNRISLAGADYDGDTMRIIQNALAITLTQNPAYVIEDMLTDETLTQQEFDMMVVGGVAGVGKLKDALRAKGKSLAEGAQLEKAEFQELIKEFDGTNTASEEGWLRDVVHKATNEMRVSDVGTVMNANKLFKESATNMKQMKVTLEERLLNATGEEKESIERAITDLEKMMEVYNHAYTTPMVLIGKVIDAAKSGESFDFSPLMTLLSDSKNGVRAFQDRLKNDTFHYTTSEKDTNGEAVITAQTARASEIAEHVTSDLAKRVDDAGTIAANIEYLQRQLMGADEVTTAKINEQLAKLMETQSVMTNDGWGRAADGTILFTDAFREQNNHLFEGFSDSFANIMKATGLTYIKAFRFDKKTLGYVPSTNKLNRKRFSYGKREDRKLAKEVADDVRRDHDIQAQQVVDKEFDNFLIETGTTIENEMRTHNAGLSERVGILNEMMEQYHIQSQAGRQTVEQITKRAQERLGMAHASQDADVKAKLRRLGITDDPNDKSNLNAMMTNAELSQIEAHKNYRSSSQDLASAMLSDLSEGERTAVVSMLAGRAAGGQTGYYFGELDAMFRFGVNNLRDAHAEGRGARDLMSAAIPDEVGTESYATQTHVKQWIQSQTKNKKNLASELQTGDDILINTLEALKIGDEEAVYEALGGKKGFVGKKRIREAMDAWDDQMRELKGVRANYLQTQASTAVDSAWHAVQASESVVIKHSNAMDKRKKTSLVNRGGQGAAPTPREEERPLTDNEAPPEAEEPDPEPVNNNTTSVDANTQAVENLTSVIAKETQATENLSENTQPEPTPPASQKASPVERVYDENRTTNTIDRHISADPNHPNYATIFNALGTVQTFATEIPKAIASGEFGVAAELTKEFARVYNQEQISALSESVVNDRFNLAFYDELIKAMSMPDPTQYKGGWALHPAVRFGREDATEENHAIQKQGLAELSAWKQADPRGFQSYLTGMQEVRKLFNEADKGDNFAIHDLKNMNQLIISAKKIDSFNPEDWAVLSETLTNVASRAEGLAPKIEKLKLEELHKKSPVAGSSINVAAPVIETPPPQPSQPTSSGGGGGNLGTCSVCGSSLDALGSCNNPNCETNRESRAFVDSFPDQRELNPNHISPDGRWIGPTDDVSEFAPRVNQMPTDVNNLNINANNVNIDGFEATANQQVLGGTQKVSTATYDGKVQVANQGLGSTKLAPTNNFDSIVASLEADREILNDRQDLDFGTLDGRLGIASYNASQILKHERDIFSARQQMDSLQNMDMGAEDFYKASKPFIKAITDKTKIINDITSQMEAERKRMAESAINPNNEFAYQHAAIERHLENRLQHVQGVGGTDAAKHGTTAGMYEQTHLVIEQVNKQVTALQKEIKHNQDIFSKAIASGNDEVANEAEQMILKSQEKLAKWVGMGEGKFTEMKNFMNDLNQSSFDYVTEGGQTRQMHIESVIEVMENTFTQMHKSNDQLMLKSTANFANKVAKKEQKLAELQSANLENSTAAGLQKIANLEQEIALEKERISLIKQQNELSNQRYDISPSLEGKPDAETEQAKADREERNNLKLKQAEADRKAHEEELERTRQQIELTQQLNTERTGALESYMQAMKALESLETKRLGKTDAQLRLTDDHTKKLKDQVAVAQSRLEAEGVINESVKQAIQLREQEMQAVLATKGAVKQASATQTKANTSLLNGFTNFKMAINMVKSSYKTMLNSARQLDQSLAQINRVARLSSEELRQVGHSALHASADLGVSSAQFLDATERWRLSGQANTMEEAMRRAEITSVGLMVSDVANIQSFQKYMHVAEAAWGAQSGAAAEYRIEIEDVANTLAYVSANTAATATAIGEAFRRSAQAASLVNVSFQDFVGLAGSAQAVTQLGGERVGTSINAIATRMSGLLAEIGRDAERAEFLHEIGVELVYEGGEVDMMKTLESLHRVWGDLTEEMQLNAANFLGGAQSQQVIAAWMEDWDKMTKVARMAQDQIGQGINGEAWEQHAMMIDTISFRMERIQTLTSALWYNMSDGGRVIKDVLDVTIMWIEAMTALLEQNPELAEMVGNLVQFTMTALPVMAALGTMSKMLGYALKIKKEWGMAITDSGEKLRGLKKTGKEFIEGINEQGLVTKSLIDIKRVFTEEVDENGNAIERNTEATRENTEAGLENAKVTGKRKLTKAEKTETIDANTKSTLANTKAQAANSKTSVASGAATAKGVKSVVTFKSALGGLGAVLKVASKFLFKFVAPIMLIRGVLSGNLFSGINNMVGGIRDWARGTSELDRAMGRLNDRLNDLRKNPMFNGQANEARRQVRELREEVERGMEMKVSADSSDLFEARTELYRLQEKALELAVEYDMEFNIILNNYGEVLEFLDRVSGSGAYQQNFTEAFDSALEIMNEIQDLELDVDVAWNLMFKEFGQGIPGMESFTNALQRSEFSLPEGEEMTLDWLLRDMEWARTDEYGRDFIKALYDFNAEFGELSNRNFPQFVTALEEVRDALLYDKDGNLLYEMDDETAERYRTERRAFERLKEQVMEEGLSDSDWDGWISGIFHDSRGDWDLNNRGSEQDRWDAYVQQREFDFAMMRTGGDEEKARSLISLDGALEVQESEEFLDMEYLRSQIDALVEAAHNGLERATSNMFRAMHDEGVEVFADINTNNLSDALGFMNDLHRSTRQKKREVEGLVDITADYAQQFRDSEKAISSSAKATSALTSFAGDLITAGDEYGHSLAVALIYTLDLEQATTGITDGAALWEIISEALGDSAYGAEDLEKALSYIAGHAFGTLNDLYDQSQLYDLNLGKIKEILGLHEIIPTLAHWYSEELGQQEILTAAIGDNYYWILEIEGEIAKAQILKGEEIDKQLEQYGEMEIDLENIEKKISDCGTEMIAVVYAGGGLSVVLQGANQQLSDAIANARTLNDVLDNADVGAAAIVRDPATGSGRDLLNDSLRGSGTGGRGSGMGRPAPSTGRDRDNDGSGGGGGSGNNDPQAAEVNEDIWRFWRLENQLRRTRDEMEALTEARNRLGNAISRNSASMRIAQYNEDYAEQIRLLRELEGLHGREQRNNTDQISNMETQISYNTQLRNAHRDQLRDRRRLLEGAGFQFDGNRLLNYDHVRSFEFENATDEQRERASEIEGWLNDWRSSYNTVADMTNELRSQNTELDNLRTSSKELDANMRSVQEQIRNTRMAKELSQLEGTFRRVELTLRRINDLGALRATAQGFLSGNDFELGQAIYRSSMDEAAASVRDLMREFNTLSTTALEFEENAEEVQARLEELKGAIIENADGIIAYQIAMNDLRVDRLASDMESFTTAVDRNSDRLSRMFNILRDGLLHGQSIGDMFASQVTDLEFNRGNEFTAQMDQRLRMENDLQRALDAFAERNIDRSRRVANAELRIRQDKYKQLLTVSEDPDSVRDVGTGGFDIGEWLSPTNDSYRVNQDMQKYFDQWRKQREKLDTTLAAEMAEAGDNVWAQQDARNRHALGLMDSQRLLYERMISGNASATAEIQRELRENQTLTGDQRAALEQQLRDIADANVDLQDRIRDAVRQRFEFEFEMMDRVRQRYSELMEVVNHSLALLSALNNQNHGRTLAVLRQQASVMAAQTAMLQGQRDALLEQRREVAYGSLEWNLISEQIRDINGQLRDLDLSQLENMQQILEATVNQLMENMERAVFGGKTMEQMQRFRDNWMTGVERELALDEMYMRIRDLEDENLNKWFDLLQQEERLSRTQMDYLNLRANLAEAERRREELSNQRTQQQLVVDEYGRFQWEYVIDTDALDQAERDMIEANRELERFRQQAEMDYLSGLREIMERAANGQIDSAEDLQRYLDDHRNRFNNVLGSDFFDAMDEDRDELIREMKDYIDQVEAIRERIANEAMNPANIGREVADAILDNAREIGDEIAESFRRRGLAPQAPTAMEKSISKLSTAQNVTENNVTLHATFPNADNANEIRQALESFADRANQRANRNY